MFTWPLFPYKARYYQVLGNHILESYFSATYIFETKPHSLSVLQKKTKLLLRQYHVSIEFTCA